MDVPSKETLKAALFRAIWTMLEVAIAQYICVDISNRETFINLLWVTFSAGLLSFSKSVGLGVPELKTSPGLYNGTITFDKPNENDVSNVEIQFKDTTLEELSTKASATFKIKTKK